jgi:hypothetical protein
LVSVQRGQAAGGFEEIASFDGAAFMAADLNADGELDLLVSRPLQLQYVRLEGHGDGTFTEATPLDIHDDPQRGQAFVADGQTSVVYDGGNGFVSVLDPKCLARP